MGGLKLKLEGAKVDVNETIDINEARVLVSDPVLWPRVRDFLWDFAPQVHESWIEGLGPDTLDASKEGNSSASYALRLMSSPRVKSYVLSALGITPFFHAFPKDDWSRLALLDGSVLREMAKWLGALACAEALRKVTDGVRVRELKSAFPGVYPEVFSFTAYFKNAFLHGNQDSHDVADNVVNGVMSAGYGVLFSAVSGSPAQVVERMKLKLPKDSPFVACVARLSADGRSEAADAKLAERIVGKLLKLKFPEAYSLCC